MLTKLSYILLLISLTKTSYEFHSTYGQLLQCHVNKMQRWCNIHSRTPC